MRKFTKQQITSPNCCKHGGESEERCHGDPNPRFDHTWRKEEAETRNDNVEGTKE